MSALPSLTSSTVQTSSGGASASGFKSASAPAPIGPTFLCEQCGCMTQFLGTSRAVRLLGVSRSTIYYWMDRGWVHWRLLPSGRRVICQAALSSPAPRAVSNQNSLAAGAAK